MVTVGLVNVRSYSSDLNQIQWASMRNYPKSIHSVSEVGAVRRMAVVCVCSVMSNFL